MSESTFRKFYGLSDFVAMGGVPAVPEQVATALGALTTLSQAVLVGSAPNQFVFVEWPDLPSAGDVAAVADAIATFVGGETTSAPIILASFAVATSASATPVVKIDFTSPPLDAGTYQVSWTTSLRMQAAAANTGIQADMTVTAGALTVHQDDAWALTNRHAYNGSLPFKILAGQTLRTLLTFQRLGASGTAEMSGARISIDKVGD